MPVYEYKGMNAAGKDVSGIMDADSDKGARVKLRRAGVFTTSIRLGGTKQSFGGGISMMGGVKTADIASMTRQLATLLGANIPLVDSLAALQDQIEHPRIKKSLSQIKDKVVEGSRLADAMKSHPEIYNDLFIHMIGAGEASGALEQVLSRLADFTEAQAALKSKVTSAMMYPMIMSVLGSAIMMYLLASVVPKITKVFDGAKVALPAPTRVLMAVSDFMQNYWYLIIIAVIFGVMAFKKYARTEKGRLKLDQIALSAPIIGVLTRKIAVSRFSRTLSTLLSSGVQLLPALDIVKNVVGNKVLMNAIEVTKNSVKEGESIAEPLKKSGQFPPMVIHMIAVGEKTGALEVMLEKVANTYDTEVDTTVGSLTTLLEPIMIVVMGGMVVSIVLAVILPILKMSEL